MTYYTGTTNANAFVAAQSVADAARTVIPQHAAWSLVESTTFDSSAVSADIYKCAKAVSGLSQDFYAMIAYSAASPSFLNFGVADGYNTSTHKPIRPAMNCGSTLRTLEADGAVLPSGTELDWHNGTDGDASVAAPGLTCWQSTPFYICAYPDALAVVWRTTSSATNTFLGYVGAYETVLGDDDPVPVMVQGYKYAYALRHPRRGGLSTAYACGLNGGAAGASGESALGLNYQTSGADFTPLAAPGSVDPNAYDAYRGTDSGAAKVAILNSYGTTAGTGRVTNGWRRGWARHVRYAPASGMAKDDTVTIDGVQHFFPGSGGLWLEMDTSNG